MSVEVAPLAVHADLNLPVAQLVNPAVNCDPFGVKDGRPAEAREGVPQGLEAEARPACWTAANASTRREYQSMIATR